MLTNLFLAAKSFCFLFLCVFLATRYCRSTRMWHFCAPNPKSSTNQNQSVPFPYPWLYNKTIYSVPGVVYRLVYCLSSSIHYSSPSGNQIEQSTLSSKLLTVIKRLYDELTQSLIGCGAVEKFMIAPWAIATVAS